MAPSLGMATKTHGLVSILWPPLMAGLCSEHREGFVLLQKVFLFVRLRPVTRREGIVSPLGAVHEGDKRLRVPSVTHRICVTRLLPGTCDTGGSLTETGYRTWVCHYPQMRKQELRG